MFEINGKRVKTWNPVKGCLHDCIYCWARRLAEGRLRNTYKYRDGFVPAFFSEELEKVPKSGFVFVCDMGDLFGSWIKREWIEQVIKATYGSEAEFLFLTKNPKRYNEFLFNPDRHILGATVESDVHYPKISKAPPQRRRLDVMGNLNYPRKMLSIEPILDGHFGYAFAKEIREVKPEFIYIGYDNHGNNLPEPSLEKTKALIRALEDFTEVRIKTLREANK